MALRPENLPLDKDELKEVARLEAETDEVIRNQYVIGKKDFENFVGGPESNPTSRRVLMELVRRYKEAGWKKVELQGFGTIQLHF